MLQAFSNTFTDIHIKHFAVSEEWGEKKQPHNQPVFMGAS